MQDRKKSRLTLYLFFAIYGSKKKDATATANAGILTINKD